jgi:hypothetical protein
MRGTSMLLLDRQAVYRESINPGFVEGIIDERINEHIGRRLLIWALGSFEWWCGWFLRDENFYGA